MDTNPVPPSPVSRAQIDHAAPADRATLLLGLIKQGEGGRLLLDGVQLGASELPEAQLAGASLRDADLAGADLRRADLSDASLRGASLTAARIEEARFAGADLIGADLTAVHAGEADFTDALLEDARLTRAQLRFANFRNALLDGTSFEGADLWAAKFDGAEATFANFKGAYLSEAQLAGVDLSGADLSGATLQKANLKNAKLRGVNFEGATLTGTDLGSADLTDANLPRVNLSSCNLRHARMSGAWLEKTWFRQDQLGGALGEEVAQEYEAARQGYLNLEQNFRSIGNPEAASWAYRRSRRMGKLHERRLAALAIRRRDWRRAVPQLLYAASDSFVEWLCDYGDGLLRVVRAYALCVMTFALVYGATGALTYEDGSPARNPVLLLAYSWLSMATSGSPDLGMKPAGPYMLYLDSLQYTLGVVLTGLFGFVLGNRIRR